MSSSKKWLITAIAALSVGSASALSSTAQAAELSYMLNGQNTTISTYEDWNAAHTSVTLTIKPKLTGKYTLSQPDLAPGIKFGIGSSLAHIPGDPDDIFYTTADRGPNGEIDVNGTTRRTFPLPNYTPTIYKIQLVQGQIKVLDTIPLKINGKDPVTGSNLITGLPNLKSRDEVPYDKAAANVISYDPYGLDVEGLAYNPKDDTFWISDEYGPYLVQVKRDGTLLQRLAPKGISSELNTPELPLKDVLPAAYLTRRQNRGAEAVGITPDGKWLFMAMQSPLRNPDKNVDNSRALRILKLDLATLQPVAEYAYMAEDAKQFKDLKQSDIVISDLNVINENTLLIDERDKNAGDKAQLKRIYQIDLSKATNILGKYDDAAKAGKTLEQLSTEEFDKAGIVPPSKRTILDVVELKYPNEKVEGISLVNGHTLVIVNDNDFGVDRLDSKENGTDLWTFELPYVLK
ncbi:esterase-like activity of phytase family protein [Paenibacillus zeisoli]|uniref:Esterase-like activity of phytase family protein n=1 Tax=Paenibacillus zeisoli TaxID=2496267 RepID=A0A433XCA0_9BACL|nr:esterase-like activity of phytase family protein [Paenibacillus zeisoli]RUT31769.1 esterase-like activity of phytase family protein [Paenibacillus zeisoli]